MEASALVISSGRCHGPGRFHFGALVTVAHDRLVSPGGFPEVIDLLSWITGDSIMQHQVPLAMDAVASDLRAQHPWLNEVVVPEHVRGRESLEAWLTVAVARWGEWHAVVPNPACWGSHDPAEDMVALGRDPSTVIPVETPERDA